MAKPARRSPRSGPLGPPAAALKAKALEIHRRLCAAYHCPIPYFAALDPLSELVSSLLSHRTKNRDSARAFERLRAAYPDWDAVLAAPTPDIEAAIAGVTWPELKAPRLQAVLREVAHQAGRLSLDHLAELSVRDARAWLERLPGVGPKTSAAVLSFSRLRGAALPVDSHHHRVAVRTALIPPTLDVGPAHAALAALLPPDWNAQEVYDHHEIFMLHGQRCCFHHPVLLDLCPTGQGKLAQSLTPGLRQAVLDLQGPDS